MPMSMPKNTKTTVTMMSTYQMTMEINATKSFSSKPPSTMAITTKSPKNDVNASLPNLLLLISSAFLLLLASKIF